MFSTFSFTASPGGSRSLTLDCGDSLADVGGRTDDCEEDDVMGNLVEACVCDYNNCNGAGRTNVVWESACWMFVIFFVALEF